MWFEWIGDRLRRTVEISSFGCNDRYFVKPVTENSTLRLGGFLDHSLRQTIDLSKDFLFINPFLTGLAGVGLGILVGFYLGLV